MSGMAVAASFGRSPQYTRSIPRNNARFLATRRPSYLPASLHARPRRAVTVPCASHPLHVALKAAGDFHNHAMAPLQQTSPSREFTFTMLAFTAYNLYRSPTAARFAVSAVFMAWPRLVNRLCAPGSTLHTLGMQLFNAALIRNNPFGMLGGIFACWLAHQATPLLPPAAHQSVRTAAFLGAVIGGARLNPRPPVMVAPPAVV